MKRYFTLSLLFLFFLFPHLARALDMPFKQVAPGVYAFIGETGLRTYENEGMNGNAGFIVTKAGVVVVDSGSSYRVAQTIHAAIRKVTKQPVKYVINTGGQDHRWLGNGYFKAQGAEIIAAAAAIDDMNARGAMQLEGLKGELKEKLAGTEVVLPTKTFEKERVLKLGGRDIHLLHFQPAHTPGDSIVWLPKEGVVFAGDLVFVDRLLGVLPFSSASGWLASFEEMAKLKPRLVIPGHGDVCDLAKARRETGDYLRLLIDHMQKAVDDMLGLQEAIDSLDQSKWSNLANYELLKGGNASRVYLEMESR
jgi:glyoxylase-like metal-dependent hydrolase (beta-lactamase superfamily II)